MSGWIEDRMGIISSWVHILLCAKFVKKMPLYWFIMLDLVQMSLDSGLNWVALSWIKVGY